MNEIDLSEKLKQLEAEVDKEVSIQNETRQRIWDEMTGNKPYGDIRPDSAAYNSDAVSKNTGIPSASPAAPVSSGKKLHSMTSMLL